MNTLFHERALQFRCKQTFATRAPVSRQDRLIASCPNDFNFDCDTPLCPQSLRRSVRLDQCEFTPARSENDPLSLAVTARTFSAHTAPLQPFAAVIKMPVIRKGLEWGQSRLCPDSLSWNRRSRNFRFAPKIRRHVD